MAKWIRDPIYGEIPVPDEFIPIIDHPLFQRLRRIKQLAFCHLVYPGVHHTRFEHSLGVFYLSRKFETGVQLFALLHDIAHPPMGHVTENALQELGYSIHHETLFKDVTKAVLQDSVFIARDIRESVLVSGDIGVDRLDYTMRDSYYAGTGVRCNWDRIVRLIREENGRLYIPYKILPNVEDLLFTRFLLGDILYFHKTILLAEVIYTKALEDLLQYYKPSEIFSWDDYELCCRMRSIGSKWWERLENRELPKMIFKGDRESALEVYEKLRALFGEEKVFIGERKKWQKPINTYMEDGLPLIEASDFIRSLFTVDESRRFWFVAVDKEIREEAAKIAAQTSSEKEG